MSQEKSDQHQDQKLHEDLTPSKYSSTSSQDHKVLDMCQNILRDFEQLSPIQVRQRLQTIIRAEQEALGRREIRFQEKFNLKVKEEQLRFREQIDNLNITFDLDAIRFEKQVKERAFELLRNVKLHHFDMLVNLNNKISDLHELQLQSLEEENHEGLITVAEELMTIKENIDNQIKQNQHDATESQESLNQNRFVPVIKDLIQYQMQNSSSQLDGSYAGIVSSEFFQNVTSGSIALSPQTTSPNMLIGQRQVFSNKSARANNLSANQIQQIQQNRQKFVYDLPSDFPFNDAQIRKNFSGSSGFTSSEQNTYGKDRSQNNDVDPRDVLRTFTNSVRSGGTLSQLQQSLTQYKEVIQSKEWSNMSPSNAYQNYMMRKNLISEVQKLAKELSKIPTEEAKMLADLSQSKLSQEVGSKSGNGLITKSGDMVVVDLNFASQIQKSAQEQIRQQAKRIVDGSATRLEPVMQQFTDVPLQQEVFNTTMTRNLANNLTFNKQGHENSDVKKQERYDDEVQDQKQKVKERIDRLRASRSQSMHYNGIPIPKSQLPNDDFFTGYNDQMIFDELSRTANYTGSRSALDNQSGTTLNQFKFNQTFDKNQLKMPQEQIKIKKGQIKIRIEKSAENKPVSRDNRLKVKFNTQKDDVEATPDGQQRSPRSTVKVSAQSNKIQILSSYDCRVTDVESRPNYLFESQQKIQDKQNKLSQQVVKQPVECFDEDFNQIAQNLKKSRQNQTNFARSQHSRSRTEGTNPMGSEIIQQAVATERKNVNKSAMSSTRRNVTIEQIKFSSQPNSLRVQSQPQSSTNQTASIQLQKENQKKPVVKLGSINFQQKKSVVQTPINAQESPYLTQQKALNKRVVHLKRPSTNIQMQSPAPTQNNNFVQRAVSRTEQCSDFIPLQTQQKNQGFRVKKSSQQQSVNNSLMQNSSFQIYASQDRPSSSLTFQD